MGEVERQARIRPLDLVVLGSHCALAAVAGILGFGLIGDYTDWRGPRLLLAPAVPAGLIGFLVSWFNWDTQVMSFWLGNSGRRGRIASLVWIPLALWFFVNLVMAGASESIYLWSWFLGNPISCGEYNGLCSPQAFVTAPFIGALAYAAAAQLARIGSRLSR